MKSVIVPASADQITVIRKQFEELDSQQPFKLMTGQGAERFFTKDAALVAFRKHKGNALLSYNAPNQPQKFLKYKFK